MKSKPPRRVYKGSRQWVHGTFRDATTCATIDVFANTVLIQGHDIDIDCKGPIADRIINLILQLWSDSDQNVLETIRSCTKTIGKVCSRVATETPKTTLF